MINDPGYIIFLLDVWFCYHKKRRLWLVSLLRSEERRPEDLLGYTAVG